MACSTPACLLSPSSPAACGLHCLQCSRNEIEGALRKVEELKSNLVNKAQEVVNLAKELGNIKPVIESLGSCLAQIPGGKKPLDALVGLSGAFETGQVTEQALYNHARQLTRGCL